MRMTSLQRLAIFAILAICPLWLSAGWDVDAWPSVQAPRMGITHAEDIVAAMEARGMNPVLAAPYRSQQIRLVVLKAKLKKAIPSWASVTNTATIADDLNESGGLIDWTVTGVCEFVQIPTNFFEYTPQSGLAGCGGLIDSIAETGYPHGPTTDETEEGGNSYPIGRTEWFTTDYGWQGMRDVLEQLKYKEYNSIWYDDVLGLVSPTSQRQWTIQQDRTSWEAAKALAEAEYPTTSLDAQSNPPFKYTRGYTNSLGWYSARMETSEGYLTTFSQLDRPLTNVWGFAYSEPWGGVGEPFDDYGSGLEEGTWVEVADPSSWTMEEAFGSEVWYTTSPLFGNDMVSPVWCDIPSPSDPTPDRGFTVTDDKIVVELDFGGYN